MQKKLKSANLKDKTEKLNFARLITPIHATLSSGLPLESQAKTNKFKLLFLDIGLLQSALHLDPSIVLKKEISQINAGAIAEQFVSQELLAYKPSYEKAKIHFWERDKPATAEVDYVISIGEHIIPIEVKSGKTGRLRSLHQFIKLGKSKLGVRISQLPLSLENNILSVPFYMLHMLPRLIEQVI